MKVTKAKAKENRARIVEIAAVQFRKRGFDGIGVADLMAAAGLTHGGFYRHFGSKSDLMAEAAACGFSKNLETNQGLGLEEFVQWYLSREHRDGRSIGCTMAALGADAARQPEEIKAKFAEGLEGCVASLLPQASGTDGKLGQEEARRAVIDTLAHVVGALVLSRACPDGSPLSDEILVVCRGQVLASLGQQ